MELLETIKTRRSVRVYSNKPIPDEVLVKILDAGRLAPSGSNRQPTRLIVVRADETKLKLAAACCGQSFIAQAPVVVVGVGKTYAYNRGNYMGRFSVLVDTAIVIDHLTLAARSEGLGSCWIGAFDNDSIKQILLIPDDWNVVALTPLGYPVGDAFIVSDQRIAMGEFIMEGRWRQ